MKNSSNLFRFLLRLLGRTSCLSPLLFFVVAIVLADEGVRLVQVNPTPFFPKVKEGEPLQQQVDLELENTGAVPFEAEARIIFRNQAALKQPLGKVKPGKSVKSVLVPDIFQPTETTIEVVEKSANQVVASTMLTLQPQKKWKIYNVAYSHHDMGYADYFHLMRRDVREMGIDLALEYCSKTDDWEKDSQFRWTVETSEPLAQWIRSNSREKVEELTRRIREGRIELGALHSSVSAEMLNRELMARLFYTPNRTIVDMLGIPPQSTALLNDVEGFPRSLPTYLKEAGIPYFYHGRNNLEDQMRPASANPAYYWMSPDGDKGHMPLFLTQHYHCSEHRGDLRGLTEPYIAGWLQSMEQSTWLTDIRNGLLKIPDWLGGIEQAKWSSSSLLSRECWDFSLPVFDNSPLIRAWNQKWSYPRVISATMTMYVNDLASQLDKEKIYVFDKDAPNSWSDQHYADFEATSLSRIIGSAVPDTEKFGALAAALGAKVTSSLELSQAYHLLLVYAEHTMEAYSEGSVQAPPTLKNEKSALECYYETERSMHRALVEEARAVSERASLAVFAGLDQMIPTPQGTTLIVYNSLTRKRTDIVEVDPVGLVWPFHVVDNISGERAPCQRMPDGRILFIAKDVPSLGYKTFRVIKGEVEQTGVSEDLTTTDTTLENEYYKVSFNPKNGAIASIWEKQLRVELVDPKATWQLNEYLYHYEGNSDKATGWYRIESAELSRASGPIAAVMTSNVKGNGITGIRQQVILYKALKRIDIINDLQKSPSGRTFQDYKKGNNVGKESVFFAIPLNVPQFQIQHELAGAVVEPISDQSGGSTTSFYGIQHFTDLSNGRFGVTVGTRECGLVEYGAPRHSETWRNESILKKVENSHVFLYPMNNWFGTNIPVDQRGGPYRLSWSVQSHEGDWQQGGAFLFGDDVSHPLTARLLSAKRKGTLPAGEASFLEIDQPNIAVSTIKPAEANGKGLIFRFNELAGKKSEVTITLPFLKTIKSAIETSLLEVDRPVPLSVQNGNRIIFSIGRYGVKTLRIVCDGAPQTVQGVTVRAAADMRVELTWKDGGDNIVRYDIYRSSMPDYTPSPRFFVGQTTSTTFTDMPRYGFGLFLNRLEPDTPYYYKIVAADRWNNVGSASDAIKVTTLSSSVKNSLPVKVEGLHAFSVSPVGTSNLSALWFYTNPESDIVQYRIHRGTLPGFKPDDKNLLMTLDALQTFRHVTPHGFKTVDRQLREYDRQVVADETVSPGTTYYYRVCGVDKAGQPGTFSEEASVTTKIAGKEPK